MTETKRPKVSCVCPIHDMANGPFFLWRLVNSLTAQTFRDWELIITKDGKMAENTNAAIKKCKGDIIKILYMDDYLASEDSLQEIIDNFTGGWLVSGCLHNNGSEVGNYHTPSMEGIFDGRNTIGSPSVLTFENKDPLLFNTNMSWLLDLELYGRLFSRYGKPTILDAPNVIIGLHEGQMTHILTEEQKIEEHKLILKKREKDTTQQTG